MALFLAVHARYKDVQLGIFKENNLIESAADESKKISKNFLGLLDDMLKKHHLRFNDLAFIAAHQGPAPFTTLRVCIATVNGFAFATGVPLIGVNGLEELIERHKSDTMVTVALLNAFSHEVYYAIHDPAVNETTFGYAPAINFLEGLAKSSANPFAFVGNGIDLYDESIKQIMGNRAHFVSSEIVSLEQVAQKALTKWDSKDNKDRHSHLMPIYLKEYALPSRANS